jgi:hypothetical protein
MFTHVHARMLVLNRHSATLKNYVAPRMGENTYLQEIKRQRLMYGLAQLSEGIFDVSAAILTEPERGDTSRATLRLAALLG